MGCHGASWGSWTPFLGMKCRRPVHTQNCLYTVESHRLQWYRDPELSHLVHSFSATPGGPGLESRHQDRLRQHQSHGRPHLSAPVEGMAASILLKEKETEPPWTSHMPVLCQFWHLSTKLIKGRWWWEIAQCLEHLPYMQLIWV